MNTDFTTVRVNGKNMNVLVCATPDNAMYFAREHKGHEGVKGTPVEDYQNDIAHDHDVTFYNYGNKHQECLGHPSRYLKNSMENEPKLKWNQQMRELIREMIHFRNSLDPKDERDPDKIDPDRVKEFEAKYDEILDLAKEEYEYEPRASITRTASTFTKGCANTGTTIFCSSITEGSPQQIISRNDCSAQ